MKITSTRLATAADAKAVAELANEHELSVDNKSSLFSEQGALDLIKGYIDPSVAYLVSFDDESGFSAVINCILILLQVVTTQMSMQDHT